jgi:Transposase DDE domain
MNDNSILLKIEQKFSSIFSLLNLKKFASKTGRKLSIPIPIILCIGIFWKQQEIKTKKSVYEILKLESLCTYKTLVVNLNKFASLLSSVLKFCTQRNLKLAEVLKHIDSTDIPVCLTKNSKHHKIMKGYSAYGHNSKGFYYGLKLHIIADVNRLPLNFIFTKANIADVKAAPEVIANIPGIFVGDAGYVSKALEEKLQIDHLRYMITKGKKGMKKLATEFDTWAYSTRMNIENIFNLLKERYGLVTSLPKSVKGYFANYLYSLTACFIK